jgi:hypothetical protein
MGMSLDWFKEKFTGNLSKQSPGKPGDGSFERGKNL